MIRALIQLWGEVDQPGDEWILDTGFWNDDAYWHDDAIWID